MNEINRFEKYPPILKRIAKKDDLEKRKRELEDDLLGYEQCLPEIRENYNNPRIKELIDQYQILKEEYWMLDNKMDTLIIRSILFAGILAAILYLAKFLLNIEINTLYSTIINGLLCGCFLIPIPHRENGKIIIRSGLSYRLARNKCKRKMRDLSKELDLVELQVDQYINEWQDTVEELEEVNKKLAIITDLENLLKEHPEYDRIQQMVQGIKYEELKIPTFQHLSDGFDAKSKKTTRGRKIMYATDRITNPNDDTK